MKTAFFAALMLIGIFSNHAAHASGDETCSPAWSLSGAAYDPCNSVPFLSPTNDTRVNLRLLMADGGHADIPVLQLSDYDRNLGYGLAPFPIDVLLTTAADPNNAPDASNDYATGDGTRCRSNNSDTSQAFINEVNITAGLSAEERTALAAGRQAIVNCNSKGDNAPVNLPSAAAKDFILYLTGAQAFYAGDFQAAHQAFAGLDGSSQPWLKETALYMVARNALNAAQVNAFDDSGFVKLDNVDQAQLKAAEAGFNAYLAVYPQGLYAASAHGLLRRVYWLMNDQERLAGAYGELVGNSALSAEQALSLAQEADNKLLTGADPTKLKDPLLLAVVDLMAMRQSGDAQQAKPFPLATLESQQPLFTSHQALYVYLTAAFHFYVEKNAKNTLAALPEVDADKPLSTYLAFSAATLRGLALEGSGETAKARELWSKLVPLASLPLARPALELALAGNQERAHQVDAVFAPDSLIQSAEIRTLLLRKAAGPALLRQQIKTPSAPQEQRDTALFVLLYKDLTRGHYQDFAGDLTLVPLPDHPSIADELAYTYFGGKADFSAFTKPANAGNESDSGYACPLLEKVAARLAQNKKDPQGLNCLGEFIRASFDFSPLDQMPSGDTLGAAASDFDGKVFSRLNGYMTIIGDAKANRKDKAYALYRAINCFAPSGNNGCGSQDISKDQRQKWFKALKSHYADTPWSASLQYYW